MKTRRRFTAESEAKVALEAIRGEWKISGLATKPQLHPNQVTQRKRSPSRICLRRLTTRLQMPWPVGKPR